MADDQPTWKIPPIVQELAAGVQELPSRYVVVGHGMDPGFLAEMLEVTRGFFNLPLDEKQKYKYSNLANGMEFSFEGYDSDPVHSEDQIMSNGFFRSPVHRVVANAESDRVSPSMFYSLDPEKEIEPLPEILDENRPRRYGKTTTKEYQAVLFERFARGERALDTVKIDLNDN